MFNDIAYDVEKKLMVVTFKGGKSFQATDVDPSLATAIEQPGASAGTIWHESLKKQYTWTEI